MPSWIIHLYSYAWFVGFLVSGIVYWVLMPKATHSIEVADSAIKNNIR
jgi:cytosine/uracil/thiamine/allantoin permease